MAGLAGMVLRSWTHGIDVDVTPLEGKLDAVGYGFFIPVFFVASGMALDVQSIARNPLRLLVFFVLLLVVRGLPQYVLYRFAMPDTRERWQFTLYVATALPILVAITGLQVSEGVMLPENAAALVGAGALSVLVFPLLGDAINRVATARAMAEHGGEDDEEFAEPAL